MAPPKLRSPEDIRGLLATRYRRNQAAWFSGEGSWPLVLPLGVPTEAEATRSFDAVRTWTAAWQQWRGPGEVTWAERRWTRLGAQQLPERIAFTGPGDVATVLGAGGEWARAIARRDRWCGPWPALAPVLPRHFTWLSTAPDSEVARMEGLLAWLAANPDSGLYPRQLPVSGVDSKWLEGQKNRAQDFFQAIAGGGEVPIDFYAACGLRQPPLRIRMRVLDPDLRAGLGGLGDIQAPVGELAALEITPRRVVVVENLQTGLAFGDLPGTVLIMGLGYGVDCLGALAWLRDASCQYWGDIDTHGFAILDRARAYVPAMASVLMDEATLLRHEGLWGRENQQHGAEDLPRLTAAEQALYRGLKAHRFGASVRLEQERVDWEYAWGKLKGEV